MSQEQLDREPVTLKMCFLAQEWYDFYRKQWPVPMQDAPLWQLHQALDQVNEAFWQCYAEWSLATWMIHGLQRSRRTRSDARDWAAEALAEADPWLKEFL
jgi:hypothetical protein